MDLLTYMLYHYFIPFLPFGVGIMDDGLASTCTGNSACRTTNPGYPVPKSFLLISVHHVEAFAKFLKESLFYFLNIKKQLLIYETARMFLSELLAGHNAKMKRRYYIII